MSQFEQWKTNEDRVQQFWKSEKIYEKAAAKRKDARVFYFLDGPPYATGSIHLGTAMNKILKDCYIRFFRMSGFNVWNQPGYDTHGLPIEYKVEQKLGFKNKKDIEGFGVDKFIGECKGFATQFVDANSNQFANLGVWMDWSRPYLTLDNDYIEGAWFTFKQGFEKGLLFRDKYPVHVCPRCSTALAYNELEYTTVTDPSIYVKFKVKGVADEFLIVWTTTPWTLPSNTGVMVKPDAEYVSVKVGHEVWVLAKRLLETVLQKVGVKEYYVFETFHGRKLKGLEYEHPLADIFNFQKNLKGAHRVILSEQYVNLEDGTGLVHTAPGHGQEDYKIGLEEGLPTVSPVGMDGKFDDTCGEFSGIFVKDADRMIIQKLSGRGLLLKEEKVTHDYPFCWRCQSPLLLISVPQWFFKVTAMRKRLVGENKKINWVPGWAGERFHNWLESLGDWPISRQRYWGIPLPIWVCSSCENTEVIGSREELPSVPKDFHRPHIDEVTWTCRKCGKCVMKRVPDVLDVWFDSGVASWASIGYPQDKKLFEAMWPVDFVLEGPDQIRGWWNSSMITSLITFGSRPFKNILFHGFVLDSHGVKMSKSKGNIVEPDEIIGKYGRDVLRFYFLLGAPWEDYYFKWEDVEDIARSFAVIRNAFNFVKMYVKGKGSKPGLLPEDRWVLSRLNTLVANCTSYLKTFHAHRAAKDILDFILNDFSRWYVKIIRDRVWPLYKGKDKKAAFYTLLTVTETVIRLLAPFAPFLAEEVYQSVVKEFGGSEVSVHLLEWPKVKKKLVDGKLESEMITVRQIVESANAARQKANLKLRWPVRNVITVSDKDEVASAVNNLKGVMLSMCNCKSVGVAKQAPAGDFSDSDFSSGKVLVNKAMDKELMEEALIKELVREVQELRKGNKFSVDEYIKLTLGSDEDTEKILEKFLDHLKSEVGAKKVLVGGLEGSFMGKLEFGGRLVEIGFDKI